MHSQSHTKRYPIFPRPYVCMNLQGAFCQWHSFNNKPQAVHMTYSLSHPFVFCWVMCLLIPRIFSGACVLCSAGNMRRNSNDSASWCSYCHGVTMAWVESQFIWLILCCYDSFLSLAAVMCTHICANGAGRNRLLEAHWFISFSGLWLWLLMDSPEVCQLSNRLGWNLHK